MTCEHRWRTVYREQSTCPAEWQECKVCGAKRYVSSYIGADGQAQEESHAWPEHPPDAVQEALARKAVDHPDHYRRDTGHEAIDVIEAWDLGFCLGNAIKYIARAGHKGDAIEDLEKARWYIDREIQRRRGSA